ncbi:MAG TPA: hypothetical protein VG078_11320 [Acidimicrobiales bacterium]|nr:hypothetical protein [Acidimicrobiales bacterium]
MSEPDAPAEAYVVEHVRTALAVDPRVGELGIVVTFEDGRLVLAGEVATRRSTVVLGEPGEPEAVG